MFKGYLRMMLEIFASATARVKLHFDIAKGFSLSRLDVRSGALRELPLDREALDALIEQWPAFRDRALSDAPVERALPEIVCPPASKAGPAPSSSPSPSAPQCSPTSGSGERRWVKERDSPAASSPAGQKTLF